MIPYIMDDTKTLPALVADQSNGLGRIPETIYCYVDEDRNRQFVAEMKVPVSAKYFNLLHTGGILKIKATDDMEPQLFRINEMSKVMSDRTVTLSLNHITYDVLKTVCAPFSARGISNTLQGIIDHTYFANKNPFTFFTDINNTTSNFSISVPTSWRELIGGIQGSVLDTFSGANNFCEIRWDNLQIQFLQHRGTNRGVVIEYGKNLTSAKQEENISDVYTACLGYAVSEESGTVIGDVYEIADVTYPKILVVDFSAEFGTDSEPTESRLTELAEEYATKNRISEPNVSLDISFELLKGLGDEELLKKLTEVRLCDTVQVRILRLGINVTAEVIKARFDSINEKYLNLTLGSYKPTFIDQINEIETVIYNNINSIKSFTLQQINALSRALQEEIDGKITTYYQSTEPANADEGDLWIDTDDNSLHRYNGTTWIAVQDSDIQTALTMAGDAQSTADRKIVTYAQASAPSTDLDVGDLWLDTDDGNILYRWNGESWVNVRDAGITAAQTLAQNALNTAQSKITTYYQASAPTGVTTGDLWIDTDDGNSLHRWNGSTWQNVQDAELAQALQAAGDAQATADGKVITFAQTSQPTASAVGDLWIDTDDGNKLYRWNGTTWVNVQDAAIASANALAQNALNSANAKTTTYYQSSAPSSAVEGDLWIDTDDGNSLHRHNGTTWVNIDNADLAKALQDAADAQSTADSKIITFAQGTAPTATDVGDLWIDTANGNELKRWNGSSWVSVKDAGIASATALAQNALNSANAKTTTYYQSSAPPTAVTGDLWIDTDDGNSLHRYNGTAWVNVQDADLAQALQDAADAQATADRKIVTYAQASAPSANLDIGDLWLDIDDNNILYRWNGESWVNVRDAGISAAQTLAQNALNSANSKTTTYYQNGTPTSAVSGDLWINTAEGNALYRYNGSSWVNVQDADLAQALQDAADAQATADSKIVTFAQNTTPTGADTGDLWVDTGNGNLLKRFNGTSWVAYQDADIATAQQTADDAAAAVVTLNNTLNSTEIFNRLTDNGNIQGIYKYQGNIYLNGEYLNANGATIGGFAVDTNSIHTKNTASDATANNAIWLSSSTFSRAIGGTNRSNLKFAIGGSFAVDQAGTLYASNAILDGRLNTGGSNGTYANLYNGVLRGGGKDRNSDNIVEYGYISFPGGQYDSKNNVHNTIFMIGKDCIVLKGHIFTNPQYDISGNRHCLNGRVEIPVNGALFHYDDNDKLESKANQTIQGSTGVVLYFQNGMLIKVDPKGQQGGIYYGVYDSMLSPNSVA